MRKDATIQPNRRVMPVLMLSAGLLLAAGCHRGQSPDVVATVNGHPIMQADMEKAYQAQLRQDQQAETPSPDQADAARLQVLQALIVQEIVDQRAAKINLTATDAEVEAKLAQLKAPYTEEQFDQKLKANKQTLDDLRRDIHRSITEDKLLNKDVNSKIRSGRQPPARAPVRQPCRSDPRVLRPGLHRGGSACAPAFR